jgi:Arc/MetJ-type ribon-helix-helix transcriptional regulator
MTLPSELTEALRAKVKAGEIRSMSSYAADAIAERLDREASLAEQRARVDDYLARFLVAPDEEATAWGEGVIAELQRRAAQA